LRLYARCGRSVASASFVWAWAAEYSGNARVETLLKYSPSLVRTPQANLSHAMRWLNVSYSYRFNWRHRTCGHLEVVRAIGGMEYQEAAQAVRRFQVRLKTGQEERRFVEQMRQRLKVVSRG